MAFPPGEGPFAAVTQSDSEALLAKISARVSNPDACFFLPASPNRRIDRDSTILLGKVHEALSGRTLPTKQPLLDRQPLLPFA